MDSIANTPECLRLAPSDGQKRLREIYHIYFLLRQKLVADVIPPIMNHAGFFERHASSTGEIKRSLVVSERWSPRMIFLTPPIRSSARIQHPVKKVAFLIKSHDQGWRSDPNAASSTWFTAGIDPARDDSRNDSKDAQGESAETANTNDKFMYRERQILRNEPASKEFRTHIVEWSVDSENDEEQQWVSGLRNGDQIAVRAWAQFPGWQNHVGSISVVIYTAAII